MQLMYCSAVKVPFPYHGQPTGLGTVSVEGQLDRVTGAVSAITAQVSTKDNKVIANDGWELFCKVTNRLF